MARPALRRTQGDLEQHLQAEVDWPRAATGMADGHDQEAQDTSDAREALLETWQGQEQQASSSVGRHTHRRKLSVIEEEDLRRQSALCEPPANQRMGYSPPMPILERQTLQGDDKASHASSRWWQSLKRRFWRTIRACLCMSRRKTRTA